MSLKVYLLNGKTTEVAYNPGSFCCSPNLQNADATRLFYLLWNIPKKEVQNPQKSDMVFTLFLRSSSQGEKLSLSMTEMRVQSVSPSSVVL